MNAIRLLPTFCANLEKYQQRRKNITTFNKERDKKSPADKKNGPHDRAARSYKSQILIQDKISTIYYVDSVSNGE